MYVQGSRGTVRRDHNGSPKRPPHKKGFSSAKNALVFISGLTTGLYTTNLAAAVGRPAGERETNPAGNYSNSSRFRTLRELERFQSVSVPVISAARADKVAIGVGTGIWPAEAKHQERLAF
jgi:hypothetical protein